MIGQSISHYRIEEQLGRGGMGVVYRAVDTRLGRPVALKFLPADLLRDDDARKRFEREARASSALDHPNICTVYEVDMSDDGQTFIAMACYDGATLKDRIAEGPLSIREIADIGKQIADGLTEAHRKGIVHRDLKPANVLITDTGVVKIVDFGLARLTGQSRITKTGGASGTPAYMAPEQVQGLPADHRADIWSLGVVLHEMACGEPPFGGDYAAAILYNVIHGELSLRGRLPSALAPIVDKCLQKDPNDRYQSVAEIRDALASTGEKPAETVSPPQRSLNLNVAFAAGILGLALLAVLVVLRWPALTNWISSESGPSERHVAVLPFRVVGAADGADVYARGLMEVLTSKLTQLDRYSNTPYWVVPTSEILSQNVVSPREARRAFGVNYVVEGSIQRSGDQTLLNLVLVDSRSLRQIDTWVGDFSGGSAASMQDEAVIQLALMLSMNVNPGVRDELAIGGSSDLGANEYYLQGRGYLQRYDEIENIESAITLFHRAVGEDPDFVLALAGLAEAHWRMYDATKAVISADSALLYGRRVETGHDLPAPVYTALGLVYAGTDRHELALEAYQHALERDPTNVDAHRGRAAVFSSLDRPNDAEAAYVEAIRLKPDYWAGYHDLGVFYFHQRKFGKAIEQFQREAELTPDNAVAFNYLGAAYFSLDRVEEAIQAFERSLQIEPSYRAFSNLATLHYRGGRYGTAAGLFERALELQDNDHRIWGFLGSALKLSGNSDPARDAFRTALSKAEAVRRVDVATAALAQAGYAAALGQRTQSLSYLTEVFALDATPDARRCAGIGEVYALLGDPDNAFLWLERALDRGYALKDLESNQMLAALRGDLRWKELSDVKQ